MLRIILYLVAVLAVALLCIFLARQHDAISVTLGSHVYTVELRGGAVYLTLGSWVYDTSLAVALGALPHTPLPMPGCARS